MANATNSDNRDKKRKRNLFVTAGSLGILLIIGFSIIDYWEGDTLELFVNISMVAILLCGAVGIFKFGADRLVYGIGLNLLNLALLFNAAIGAGDMIGLFGLNIVPLLIFFFLEKPEAILPAKAFKSRIQSRSVS